MQSLIHRLDSCQELIENEVTSYKKYPFKYVYKNNTIKK